MKKNLMIYALAGLAGLGLYSTYRFGTSYGYQQSEIKPLMEKPNLTREEQHTESLREPLFTENKTNSIYTQNNNKGLLGKVLSSEIDEMPRNFVSLFSTLASYIPSLERTSATICGFGFTSARDQNLQIKKGTINNETLSLTTWNNDAGKYYTFDILSSEEGEGTDLLEGIKYTSLKINIASKDTDISVDVMPYFSKTDDRTWQNLFWNNPVGRPIAFGFKMRSEKNENIIIGYGIPPDFEDFKSGLVQPLPLGYSHPLSLNEAESKNIEAIVEEMISAIDE